MIQMHQTIVPDSRTPEKGSKWIATCTIEGQDYSATSRSGAAHELGRVLVAAGIADQEVRVTGDTVTGKTVRRLPGYLTHRSLHQMAQSTCQEGATAPLHRAKWTPHPRSTLAVNVLPKTGVEAEITMGRSHHAVSQHSGEHATAAIK